MAAIESYFFEYYKFVPFAAFVLFLALQTLMPRRSLKQSGVKRAIHNAYLFLLNGLLMRFLVPLSLVSIATWALENNLGLFNFLELPTAFSVLVCVVILDLSIYAQHVATHHFPLLWRLHKVHHADTDMDVSTAIRFHPLELVLSLIYKSAIVVILGAPVQAVILFEMLLFIGPAFNHSNIKLPSKLDAVLRCFIATPDTHRAHHSKIIAEQNTNYGFFLIWWDKLFNTYTQKPKGGHQDMPIGLSQDSDQCDRVDQMLIAPFR